MTKFMPMGASLTGLCMRDRGLILWRDSIPPMLSYTRGVNPPSSLGKRMPWSSGCHDFLLPTSGVCPAATRSNFPDSTRNSRLQEYSYSLILKELCYLRYDRKYILECLPYSILSTLNDDCMRDLPLSPPLTWTNLFGGSSLPGLSTWNPPLGPTSTLVDIF